VTITVKIHTEPMDAPDFRMGWWAESDQVPGWTASAESLRELKELVNEGVRFALDDDTVEVVLALVPFEDERPQGPERVTPGDPEVPRIEINRAIRTTTLVPA
jgi:hypothetical protein